MAWRSALHLSADELLEASPDAVVALDAEGRIAFVNRRAEAMFGYERTEVLGQAGAVLLSDRRAEARGGRRADPPLVGADTDLLARRKDGSEFPVEVGLIPVETAHGVQVIATLRDVTHRHRIARERELTLAVAKRARLDAERALRRCAEAERLRHDVTNRTVHDLKNPVIGIRMVIEAALRRRDELSARQLDTLLLIDRACGEMIRSLQNLLLISRIEQGRMPVVREAVAITALVDEVVQECAPAAEQTGKRLQVATDADVPAVTADRDLLKRVLVNLVVDALGNGRSRELRLEGVPAGGGAVVVRVAGHGRGIPEGEQPRIVERCATEQPAAGGDPRADTGLGLPFCRLAVEHMGGRLRIAPGAATVIVVALPVHRRAPAGAAPSKKMPAGSRSLESA
ncbi:MAG TPA: PAS domain-containing sensor histidine kinase [Candidatus Binatia bacterium]|nr:PAS domain-containing sensor histidine kinase [Candidatus Binatia bacterium]